MTIYNLRQNWENGETKDVINGEQENSKIVQLTSLLVELGKQ